MNGNTQRSALVTGGTGSIGIAVCERLLKAGYRVVAADITGEPRTPMPSEVEYQQLDVRSADSARAVASSVAEQGPLHVLVNAHGILHPSWLEELDSESITDTLEVNIAGVVRMCGAVAPLMDDGGAIVSLSSHSARIGRLPGSTVYAASKAAVESVTRTLACELAPRLRVTSVGVGFVETPMRGAGGQMRERANATGATSADIPLGRLATTGDIAEAVAFLASDAASYITGTTLMVDGGVTAR
jgi:NAD(P)-dependent dehydrogenase (short-subunit alcohol dehydrogenase family)